MNYDSLTMHTRREFLERTALTAGGLATARFATASATQPNFPTLRRPPNVVTVETENGERRLRAAPEDRWEDGRISISIAEMGGAIRVMLSAASDPIKRVRLRWQERLTETRLILGDAWERGYGDLEWRGFVPDRAMPWYVALWDGRRTSACGVRTGASAFCYWQVDPEGLTLIADVRSGAAGIRLGERPLTG